MLTGVDITDSRAASADLCRRLLDRPMPALPRLRLSSLDGIEIDDALFELIAGEPRVMPHFHLSLQAGDDLILKRMKRRHSRADAVRMVERIKAARPDATIGADLIAGFPTETEDMALNSLQPARRLRRRRRPRLSLFAAARHAGGADAAGRARARQGARARAFAKPQPSGARAGSTAWSAPPSSVLIEGGPARATATASRRCCSRAPQRGEIRDGRESSRRDGDLLVGAPWRMSWLDRLRGGFTKTADRLADNLTGLTTTAALDTATLDDIEEALIASDLGPRGVAPDPRGDRRAPLRAARRARAAHHPRRRDREDPRAGRQAARDLRLSRGRT